MFPYINERLYIIRKRFLVKARRTQYNRNGARFVLKIPPTHRWDVTPREAIRLQRDLAARVIEEGPAGQVRFVAGVDVGFEGADNQTARAAVVVLSFPELEPVDYAVARARVRFPYIPGLLSFRETPVLLAALKKLKIEPDVIMVDGHGRAHPRRMGIACHLGVLLDRSTVGCAKSILCGTAAEPRNQVGASTPLRDAGEQIGVALRTRENAKPIFVSVGHRVSLERATELVLRCCTRFRLPETTRYAHRVAGGERIDLESARKS
ncbi:MAG: deoxyribonuclease V [Chloroflexota bacterium]|nr:deoxyribonuclease V [Chloroflexota bacterium]